jgi:hypothetical protein
MSIRRRVFVSLTFDSNLTDAQNGMKWGIVQKIVDHGYTPHIFFPTVPTTLVQDIQREMPWGAARVEEAIRGSVGAVMIGYPRWNFADAALASEYTHYEAGVAQTVGVPMFMVAERGMTPRGAFDLGSHQVCEVPRDAELSWLDAPQFQQAFDPWLEEVGARFDVFLGYSSRAHGTAKNLRRLLENKGASVLDWQEFGPGTILEQIAQASRLCTSGIFLFTSDDPLEGQGGMAAPRDNVVFEAGFFAHAKGQRRVLIVLEAGAKMPADLGGAIYAPMPDRADIEALDGQLDRFLREL